VTGETLAGAVFDAAVAPKVMQGIAHEEFDLVVREHQQRIYRVLLALLRDPDAAANLTQDCFVRAFESRKSFRGEASVGTWLVRIAVNLARDYQRSKRHGFWRGLFRSSNNDDSHDAMAMAADPQPTAERVVLAREKAAAVWAIVDRLSPQQREVFILRFAEEMPLEQIALALRLQLGTVKTHLSRALSAVRAEIKESERE